LLPSVIGGGATKRNTANLERVDVLKGPGSILYGRSEPGGIINLVTKQPLETPYHAIQQQIGSFANYRTTIDSTGPITEDGSLLYRFNMAYENLGSFRDFVHNEGVFIAPVVRWNIDPATQITAEFEYQQFDGKPDPGIPPIGNWPASLPRNRFVGDPLNDRNRGYRILAGFHWSHEFDQDWKILHRFTYEHMSIDSRTLFFGKASADGTLNRSFNIGADTNTDRFYTTVNLQGTVETGPAKHKLLFGFDFFHIDDNLTNNCCTAAPAFNIFSPSYLPVMLEFNNPALSTRLDYAQEWYSFYFQDQIELPYNVFLLGGLRYDNAIGHDNIRSLVSTNDDRVSPRGGVLWRPISWLSVYGSYSESFGASNSLFRTDGLLLKPQTAQQWEAGAKTEFFDGRLSATFAYFDLKKQNLRIPDPLNPNFSRTIGEAESRGFEFDLAGEVAPGWRVIGAYSYLPFAQITKDGDSAGGYGNQGKRLFLAPQHWGSLWSTYEFQTPELTGLKAGAGFVAVGPRPGNAANNYEVPGYTTANMMLSYSWWFGPAKCTAQLNIDNLLDKPYFVGTNSGNFITVGAPRTFLGSLKVEF
jgi:iron complex outermembrane receptor protein